MSKDILVPTLGESITEATVAQWFKKSGDAVAQDEPICELETDKVTVEVPAPVAGAMGKILVEAGATVEVGAVLAQIEEGKAGKQASAPPPAPAPKEEPTPKEESQPAPQREASLLSPAVRHLVAEHNLDPATIRGTGRDGRITKADVLAQASGASKAPAPASTPAPAPIKSQPAGGQERVPMSRLRQTIATRLKQAQNTAAILTTFNEVDMQPIIDLRAQYKEEFQKKYDIRLGFMGFFVKACVLALQEIPNVNAQIEGEEIVFNRGVNMGVAVSTEKGLVVPVLRDAHKRSLAEIESAIADMGVRAREGKLELAELQGGTFSISNGGVFGSLLSTPILNVPQSGILGMHKIQERPVAVNGQVVVRPMMYLALSYDHRLVDGREAVTFLVRVKDALEDPQRLILEV